MKALVLSGGGARGAYQMGVWKALKKLNIKFDIVTGTSIGALNGMMYVQNNYHRCLNLWNTIDFSVLYDDFEVNDNKEIVKKYADKIIKGGINTDKIKNIIYRYYNPTRLYRSRINYGIVTYNLTNKEVLYATKNNTNPKKMKEYILGSATCFPVFKPTKIDNYTFIDGGYYDNLPINLAITLGATEILAVDLEAIGITKKVKDDSVNIKYIRPTSKLDSFLMFEKNAIRKMIKLGYNDTMKMYGKLEGIKYTFKKGTIDNIHNLYKNKINKLCDNYNIKIDLEKLMNLIEDTLEILELPIEDIYDSRKLVLRLNEKIKNIKLEKVEGLETIKNVFNKQIILKNIYTKINNNDKIAYNIFIDKEIKAAILLQAIKR